MLDYIKKQIQARQPGIIQTSPEPEDVPNDVIVEYAKLFQELDDISDEGTDAGKERKLGIDIPLEDDFEVDNIEFKLSDGRVTDVPGDATVTEAYQRMKTYDEFYTEAADQVVRMPRETNASYDRRVSELAEKLYNEYCDYADGIGAFGFSKIELNEEKVPSKLNIDFGPMKAGSDKSFMAKVKTFFATDDEHCITKKQLDSVRLVQNGAFAKIGEPLMAYMESHYDVPSDSSVWDVCTPKNLIVPKGNGDSFCVVLEYTNEITGNNEYFGWTKSVRSTDGSMYQEALTPAQEAQKERVEYNAQQQARLKELQEGINFFNKADQKDLLSPEELQHIFDLGTKAKETGNPADKKEHQDAIRAAMQKLNKIKSDRIAELKKQQEDIKAEMIKKDKELAQKVSELRRAETTTESFAIDNCVAVNMESFINETRYENKDTYIQESNDTTKEERVSPKRPPSRFYQEAIDFGGGEGDGGSDLPPATDDGGGSDTAGNDTPPAPDGGDSTGGSDQNIDSGNASDAPEANGDSDDKETAAVNDVSSEIAEKVADDTQDAAGASSEGDVDTEITFDDDTTTDDGMDSSDNNIDNEPSVDEQLDDLDNTGSQPDKQPGEESMDDDTESDDDITDDDYSDIESMTIDELMEHGSEKLKSMPLNEIKKFLTSGTPEAVQESFFITKRNVDKEIDVNLRKCLGILNDKSIKIDKLLRNFRMAGHKLNRVLTKAVKLKGAYSSDEVQSIQKLNRALVELMTSLKKSNTASYVSSVKRNILAFTSESKKVAAFVEDRLKGNNTVQEGFVQEGLFLSDGNVKKRLAKKITPVYADLSEIARFYDQGKLTKGKLTKMYKPKKSEYTTTNGMLGGGGGSSTGLGGFTSTTQTHTYEQDTIQMMNLQDLVKIISKIMKKPKVQRAFNSDEIQMIADLGNDLDDFIDYIESLIIDGSDNKTIIDQVGKDVKELIALLSKVHSVCTGLEDNLKSTRFEEDETAMNDIDDSTSDTNTDATEDSVEDTTGEETPDEGDSAPDTEGDEE